MDTANYVLILNDLSISNEFRLGSPSNSIDWQNILNTEHEDVLKYVVRLLGDHYANRDGFVLCLDSALETVFDALWKMGNYQDIDLSNKKIQPNRGHRLRGRTQFSIDYPDTTKFFRAVNDLRNRSEVAHRKNSHANTKNRPVSHDDMKRAMKFMPMSLIELARLHPE